LPAHTPHTYSVPSSGKPEAVYSRTLPTSLLIKLVSSSRFGYALLLTLKKYTIAPGEAFHWKVIEVPYTVAPLFGEDKVGATSVGGGGGVGVGSVSPPNPNSEQPNPEESNMQRSNTIVILGNFILYLQFIQGDFQSNVT
jgi:hypothetical protein